MCASDGGEGRRQSRSQGTPKYPSASYACPPARPPAGLPTCLLAPLFCCRCCVSIGQALVPQWAAVSDAAISSHRLQLLLPLLAYWLTGDSPLIRITHHQQQQQQQQLAAESRLAVIVSVWQNLYSAHGRSWRRRPGSERAAVRHPRFAIN